MGCPKGEYYCNDEQKCKSIPAGHKVLENGELVKESFKDAIRAMGSSFKDEVTGSKDFKKFKNTAEKFGKTGKIDIKKLAKQNKDFPDFIKNAGKNALRVGLQSGLRSLNKEEKDIKENIGFQQSAMKKTDTGKGPLGSHSVRNVLKPERDKLLAKALPSVGGVQVKMDADGMVPNAGAFAQQTVSKELKNIGSSSIAKNNPMIQKGLEVAGKENANTEFNINKNILGTQANRYQGVADSINTKIKNPKKTTVVQGTSSTRTEELDGSKLAIGATAGIFGAGLELARRGKKFADKLKEKMDKRTKLKEETQGGINIETYTDGIQFNEIETINIIEPPKIKSPSYMTFIEDIKEETK
tara:strand:+ start:156 stop:1223 length:1068 start_codon:yes stop_codon:yes gene_type:complete